MDDQSNDAKSGIKDSDVPAQPSTKSFDARLDIFASLFDNLRFGITVWNHEGRLEYANRSFSTITGYTPDEIQTLEDWFPRAYPDPDYRNQVLADWQAAIDLPEAVRAFKVCCKDGEVKDIEFHGVFLPEGRALVTMTDVTARKQAEEALRKSEARYQSVWENSGAAALIIEEDTTVSMVNAEFEKLSGMSSAEIVGKRSWTEFVVPDDLVRMRTFHKERRHKASDVPRQYEFGFLDKDGNVRHVVNTVTLIPGTKQSISSLIDISARKAMEEGIRESQELYAKLMAAVPDIVVRTDMEGKIQYINDAALEISGYSRSEVEGQSMLMFIAPEDHARVVENIMRMYEGPLGPREYHLVMKDGRKLLFEVNGDVLRHPDGTPYELVNVCRDVTARKQAEVALRESDARYRAVLEASPDPIVAYDIHGRVTYLNPAFTGVFGWNLEELLNQRIDYVPEDQQAKTREMIAMVRRGESFAGFQTQRRTKTGEVLDISMSAAIWRDESGDPEGSVITLQDVTERKKMEQQLVQAYKMEALGTLAGGIAHDFNNILSALIGYTELSLPETQPGSLIYGNLQKVLKAGERARNLVKQILTFSRQSDQEFMPVQIKPIVIEALKFIRASIPTSIEIRSDLASTAMVLADPTQIHQVLMNLCTNAAHAMQAEGGFLDVSLRGFDYPESEPGLTVPRNQTQFDLAPGRYLEIRVADTGHGMAPEVLNRIFDPFYTTKAAGKGTGMGLAVVHGIVKSHNGAIKVASQPDEGTTVQVWLPVHKAQPAAAVEQPAALPTGKERILFVDDEDFQVDLGEQLLQKLGYRVVCFRSSTAALDAFSAAPEEFDLVITDMTMPEMTGDILAQELIKIQPDLPVIVCTGFSEKLTPENAEALGIKGLLMKPVVITDMANTVRGVLDQAQANRKS